MSNDSGGPTPPEGLPEQIASDMSQLTAEELRKTIIHAQEILQSRGEEISPVEPNPGDDIVRVTEHEGYTEVVKWANCTDDCGSCPHGPYLYHVTEEPRPEGGEKPHWTFMGEVNIDE